MESHPRWSLGGEIQFFGFDVRDRARSREFKVILGFGVPDDGSSDDEDDPLAEDLRQLSHYGWSQLVEVLHSDELWLTELALAGAVVVEDGKEPLEFTLYTKPDQPKPGHLRPL